MNKYKKDFPIFNRTINGKKLIYLDSAATSQKPLQVIEAMSSFYKEHNANIHRGIHTLSQEASEMYEEVAKKTAKFINARSPEEIIFTQNTTFALNHIARALPETSFWSSDGEVVITEMEHHANILPWAVLLKGKVGVEGLNQIKGLKVARLSPDHSLDLDHLASLITSKTKVVAITHISNVLGAINDIKQIVKMVKSKSNALVVVDGAQAVGHIKVDVQSLGCDFYVFSAHKMLGPTGVGVLWGRKEVLEKFPPFIVGGSMIKEVYFDKVLYAESSEKFIGGTPDIGGVIGFGAAIDYINTIGISNIENLGNEIVQYVLERLNYTPGVQLYFPKSGGLGQVVSFNVKGIPAHDMASILDAEGIAVRSGHHCAMPLHNVLGIPSSVRASFYIYNEREDIDALITGIEKAKRVFGIV